MRRRALCDSKLRDYDFPPHKRGSKLGWLFGRKMGSFGEKEGFYSYGIDYPENGKEAGKLGFVRKAGKMRESR